MSDKERRDIVDDLIKVTAGQKEIIDKHSRVLFGDEQEGSYGLMRRMEANEMHDKMVVEELKDIKSEMKSMHSDLMEKIGEVSVWKEGIQDAPKRIKKGLISLSAVLGACIALYAFFSEAFKKLIDAIIK